MLKNKKVKTKKTDNLIYDSDGLSECISETCNSKRINIGLGGQLTHDDIYAYIECQCSQCQTKYLVVLEPVGHFELVPF